MLVDSVETLEKIRCSRFLTQIYRLSNRIGGLKSFDWAKSIECSFSFISSVEAWTAVDQTMMLIEFFQRHSETVQTHNTESANPINKNRNRQCTMLKKYSTRDRTVQWPESHILCPACDVCMSSKPSRPIYNIDMRVICFVVTLMQPHATATACNSVFLLFRSICSLPVNFCFVSLKTSKGRLCKLPTLAFRFAYFTYVYVNQFLL